MRGCSIPSEKIAILGATSHIAKGLIYNFSQSAGHELYLFARSLEHVQDFLRSIHYDKNISLKNFGELKDDKYDVIINCIGISSTSDFKEKIPSYFRLTEQFDNLILDYLDNHPYTIYINFSSGAVHGTDFSVPADESTLSKWDINHISEADYYGIAKLNSEAKHRALKNLNIIDLRVFGYFSRFISLESKFMLTEVISCVKESKVFITGVDNIVRDYIHPKDLFLLIQKCIEKHKINNVFDVYSLKPVAKFEIINYFAAKYGLKYEIKDELKISAITGAKDNYYSNNRKAQLIGYNPKYTSSETITEEASEILKR